MLTSLADYAAVAIENASLYQNAQTEIEERKLVESALRKSEERYALAIQSANDGLWDWDLTTGQIYYSPRWKAMLGFDEDEITNHPNEWFNRIHPEDLDRIKLDISAHIQGLTAQFESEHRILHKDGNYRWVIIRGIAVREDNVVRRMAGSQSDITDRKTSEQRLIHDAFHDTLTGLPNRALLMDRLGISIERSRRQEKYSFAVLFMDLDNFKEINDSLGHLIGDQLLITAGNLLKASLRPTDTLARMGGDEFVILLEDIGGINDVTLVAKRINNELKTSVVISDNPISVTASIGIVIIPPRYILADDILRDADIAMYRAKANGRAKYEIFDPAMQDKVSERLSLEIELQKAIENHELQVYYQPIVSLTDGRIDSFEALVRWHHPVLGLLYPPEFIQLAKETGLIIPIDNWVMQEACRQLQQWQNEVSVMPFLGININVSANQVKHPEWIDQIKRILGETGLQPDLLRLEISAKTLVENGWSRDELFKQLNTLGVKVQIDDFGLGHTSLSCLSNIPITALKIDRSFIDGLLDEPQDSKITSAIIMLTRGLGIKVIAEGVETEAQLNQLRKLGCEYGQGFLFSVPLDNDQIKLLLDRTLFDGQPYAPWRTTQFPK